MPSIFSRSRTPSTPKRSLSEPPFDEFGRITSRGTAKAIPATSQTTKRDKKNKDKSRLKGNGSPAEVDLPEFTVPDGSFLPLNLDPQRYELGEEPPQERRQLLDYSYLSYQRHVVLGLEEVARLVDVIGSELGARGLTTPFIFSSLALDVSANAVKRLINTFLNTCRGRPTEETERLWREEARFAGPQELGMFLRWGLARIVRIVGGQEVRGLLSYAHYAEWADVEAVLKYPPTHFEEFIAPLEPIVRSLVVGLLTLISKFAAHSATSGHTPPTLSALFGPLLFGLGPSTLAFHHVYVHYLRAATATEHLILAYIRWQDAPGGQGTSAAALGMPSRLKQWIQGYPAMLPTMNPNERPQPRRGARTTRVISVRRNVRMYSPDLVKTASTWAQRPRGMSSTTSDRSFATSREWDRISPPTLKLPPRYSDGFRKRMDLPANFHPETGAGAGSPSLTAPSLLPSISGSSVTSLFDEKELGLLGGAPEDRFRSLTDLKWGEFEASGFGDVAADNKKLQFDLTEGARAARAAKRATLSWQDFSAAGFSRSDAPLSATLQFSHPVINTVSTWPAQSAELHRKLKKAQKALPSFGWDTEPVLGGEEVIEEAFIDVFCDLIYGSGWMDVERGEEVDRECNWALVEFKSLPVTKSLTTSGTADPRTGTTLMLFEEFVPLEYRQQLQESGTSRRRLPSLLFGTSSKKQWKPAATLNGRPYVVGHVPHSPSYREVEFEGLLRANDSATKVLSLKMTDKMPPQSMRSPSVLTSVNTSPIQTKPKPNLFLSPPPPSVDVPLERTISQSSDNHDTISGRSATPTSTPNPNRRSGRFRLPVSPTNRTAGLSPSEYENVDFEARLASFDEDDPNTSSNAKHRKQRSRDDAWVDILVANNSRRLAAQDAGLGNGLKGGQSDPELASQEVSEVLAAVRAHPLSDDEDDVSIEPVLMSEDARSQISRTTEGVTDTDRSTTPAREPEPDLEEEEEEPIITHVQKKGMGYFDLHPERRHARPLYLDGRDSRDQSRSPSPHIRPDSASQHLWPSYESAPDSTYEDAEDAYDAFQPPLPPPKPITPTSTPPRSDSPYRNDNLGLQSNGKNNSLVVPAVAVVPPPEEPVKTPSPIPAASKTSALIEMYRERERGNSSSPAPGSVPLLPSKLPVRSGQSLLPAPLGARPMPMPGARPHSPARSVSPSAKSVELDDSLADFSPAPLGVLDEGPSLTRYVHGAPLHNVLEEEEEEEV